MKTQMRRKGRKSKRGASLAMVLISMTVLIIMGTLFTTISMRSYLYSYAKLCKQQAYYTAMSSVESFHSLLKSNPGIIGTITQELNRALDEDINDGIDPTNVTVTIGSTYGRDDSSYVPNGFFDSYMGRCTLRARYANVNRNEISIEANATYKGYSDFARAKIARTNAAASELKKIFDNTFCLQSPISTIIGTVPNGDIYISQPVLPEFTGDSLTDDRKAYNEVLGELKDDQNVNTTLPGQYIRDKNGNIVTTGSEGRYNKVLRDELYGKAQASTGKSDLLGHTRPMDIDNKPIQKGTDEIIYFNDWAELYMFAPTSDGKNAKTAINGNVYANSRVLIGLLDRDEYNTSTPMYWDEGRKRLVYPKDSTDKGIIGDIPFSNYISKNDSATNYEHGFASEVFFDHLSVSAYNRTVSQFRVNGNMYFWEDVRIENFDSTKTDNAQKGIKNNIYAYKNLVIDGTYILGRLSSGAPDKPKINERYVTIYGDVIVQGNAQIIGANIEGDVYCFGDEMLMVDTNVTGNVYFAGGKFTSDYLDVSGNLIIENKGTQNTTYTNYDKNTFGAADTVGRSGSNAQWGAVLTNTSVRGSLWSAVNTQIVTGKWEEKDWGISESLPDYYGNVYVKTYLFFDATRSYGAGYSANWTDSPGDNIGARWNCFEKVSSESVIYADKLQIKASQADIKEERGERIDVNKFSKVCVGEGGFHIYGNSGWSDEYDWGKFTFEKSIVINEFYRLSGGECKDMRIGPPDKHSSGIINGILDPPSNSSDIAKNIAKNIHGKATKIDDALNMRLADLKEDFLANDGENPRISVSNMQYECFGRDSKAEKEIWKGKVIKLRKWSAPEHKTETEIKNGEPGTYYHGYDLLCYDVRGFESVDEFKNYLIGNAGARFSGAHPEAGEVSSDGKTLTIKESVVFAGEADFSSFETVIFDTSGGNIHVRFQDGAVFGKNTVGAGAAVAPSKVVLRGGNMVFFYLEQEENYSMNDPTLRINDGCNFGVVEASQGTNYGNDGLYVISNDDILIRFAGTTEFNGFVYAPWGHLFIMPGNDGSKNTFNGCMAIESLIMLNDTGEAGKDIFKIIKDWWDQLMRRGLQANDIIVTQYANCVYNYVMPPLIVDAGMSYGGTDDEVVDFGRVVWEFMGFY